jgi:glyoxylase-like metal-dependent hydrolase (beta-lactamase superfamily II)
MDVHRFTFNPFQTNCFICESDGEAVLIDPSCATPDEIGVVEEYLGENGIVIRHLLLTHGHIDHIFGCAHFTDHFGLSFQMNREDLPLLSRAEEQASMFGVKIAAPPLPSLFIDEGDAIEFGSARLDVLYTPGHSPGSISFYDEASRTVLAGDVLFQGSIGRTDLWRGSLPELMRSIFETLIPLGDDVRVHPGHGPETTIGRERHSNPFLTHGFAEL